MFLPPMRSRNETEEKLSYQGTIVDSAQFQCAVCWFTVKPGTGSFSDDTCTPHLLRSGNEQTIPHLTRVTMAAPVSSTVAFWCKLWMRGVRKMLADG